MCCFISALLFVGPRFALFIWWLFDARRFNLAIGAFLLSCLGFVFLPWTMLAYLAAWNPIVGVQGFGWVVVGLGFLFDLTSHGGLFGNRRRLLRI